MPVASRCAIVSVCSAAFASLSDSDKQQLLQNVLLAEELSLQRVGMDNLRYDPHVILSKSLPLYIHICITYEPWNNQCCPTHIRKPMGLQHQCMARQCLTEP